ncbi:uncharacterized protein DS421_18g606040 [Arachis hypogaea]|nr:uncharacterized protein DS421_18g606040 [Arachis hypogaea]
MHEAEQCERVRAITCEREPRGWWSPELRGRRLAGVRPGRSVVPRRPQGRAGRRLAGVRPGRLMVVTGRRAV